MMKQEMLTKNVISPPWTSLGLFFVFSWNYLILITWTLFLIVDNMLMLNCLVFSGLIVLVVGLRKCLLNVTIILLAKFQFQSDDVMSSDLLLSLAAIWWHNVIGKFTTFQTRAVCFIKLNSDVIILYCILAHLRGLEHTTFHSQLTNNLHMLSLSFSIF